MRQRLQIGINVVELVVAEDCRPIWRHVAIGVAHEGFKRIERQRRACNHLAVAGRDRTLAVKVVALPAAVLDKGRFAFLGIGGESVALSTEAGGKRRQRDKTGTTATRTKRMAPPQRGCVMTLTSAGWPDLTTATASLIAGPRSAGSTIGPFAHQPIDFASS